MQPIWTLYSRRIFSRLAYWLSALGYNLRDRSLNNRLYLIYFIAFWAVWVGAVLSFIAATLADWLVLLPYSPAGIISLVFQLILAGWGFIQLWQVTHRSPFVFTEEDAYLICQVPASRRRIGFALFLQGWLGSILPFIAGAVVLAFTLAEVQLLQADKAFILGKYLLISLRAVSIIIPFQAGVLALLWGLGAYRLHPSQRSWMSLVAPLVLLVGAAAIGLRATLFFPYASLALPLRLPLDAAFGVGALPWIAGLGVSLVMLLVGIAALYLATPRMSLTRAAQETSRRALIQSARSYGIHSLADALGMRQRLGSGRAPSRLLSSPGAGVLFDKDEVQTRRTLTLAFLLNLMWILGLNLGMFSSPTWQMQLILGGIWALGVGTLATRRLRSDLARWWILRTLPVKAEALLRAELRLPWTLVVWMGWLSVLVSPLELLSKIFAVVIIPFIAASAGFAAAYDILHRCQARTIMSPSIAEENIPQVDVWGALRGILSVVVPLGLLIVASAQPGYNEWGLGAVIVAAGLARFNYRAAVSALNLVG